MKYNVSSKELLSKKIIEFLKSIKGKEIALHNLQSKLSPKKLKQKKNSSSPESKTIEEILEVLEKYGLIKISKKKIFVNLEQSLTGIVTVSRRGDGFIKIQSREEVYVDSKYLGNSFSGDLLKFHPIFIGKKGKLEGQIVAIIKRGRTKFRLKVQEKNEKFVIGKILDIDGKEKEGYLFTKKIDKLEAQKIKKGSVIFVEMNNSNFMNTNFIEFEFQSVESGQNSLDDWNRILFKYDYTDVYPAMNLDFLKDSKIVASNDRKDCRGLYTVTIDGETAKDFDDAISFETIGTIQKVYVHIADVSHYVEKDGDLDLEAYHRGNSVYLGNRVIPMLPNILSENLCSLVENQDRLSFTVEMEFDEEGNILSSKFYKSIIRVSKRYTYENAQEDIDSKKNPWLYTLSLLVSKIRDKRVLLGRVDLEIEEPELLMDASLKVQNIQMRQKLFTHSLIEELMLSANNEVAKFINSKKIEVLYRVHEKIDETKIEKLNQFLNVYGIKYQLSSLEYDQIKAMLAKVKGTKHSKLLCNVLLRSFKQAYYTDQVIGHWGLGFESYCHFTSPIRRYADLICHRVLGNLLKGKKPIYSKVDLNDIGMQVSSLERRAIDAERDYFKLKAMRFIQDQKLLKCNAKIQGFNAHFVYLELENPPVEGVLSAYDFSDMGEIESTNDFSFYSKKYSKHFFIGDILDIQIKEINFDEIRIYCLIEENRKTTK